MTYVAAVNKGGDGRPDFHARKACNYAEDAIQVFFFVGIIIMIGFHPFGQIPGLLKKTFPLFVLFRHNFWSERFGCSFFGYNVLVTHF